MEDSTHANPPGTDDAGMGGHWYVRHEGVVRGPYSSTRVRRLLLSESLLLSDQVSSDGRRWQSLATVPEVVPHQFRRDRQENEQELLQEAGIWRRQARVGVLVAGALVLGILGLVLYLDTPGDSGADCAAVPAAGVDWEDCRFAALSAPGADLREVLLANAALPNARLQGAVLAAGDLRYADLKGADLSYADLRGAALKGADLRGVDLTYADLRGADLSFADLRDARLGGARLEDVLLHGALWADGRTCPAHSRGACASTGRP